MAPCPAPAAESPISLKPFPPRSWPSPACRLSPANRCCPPRRRSCRSRSVLNTLCAVDGFNFLRHGVAQRLPVASTSRNIASSHRPDAQPAPHQHRAESDTLAASRCSRRITFSIRSERCHQVNAPSAPEQPRISNLDSAASAPLPAASARPRNAPASTLPRAQLFRKAPTVMNKAHHPFRHRTSFRSGAFRR